MKMNNNSALIIVDVQNDFLPGGALGVKDGDKVIPVINDIQSKFVHVIATQDFHPQNHKSFASNHAGKQVGEMIDLNGLPQMLWPNHCVQGTEGAYFSDLLKKDNWEKVFQKGMLPEVDSYSGFFDNARKGDTGLAEYLRNNGIDTIYLTGLAQDYCVKFTALDARDLGFKTFLIADGTKAVNLSPEDGDKAIREMEAAGVTIIESKDLN